MLPVRIRFLFAVAAGDNLHNGIPAQVNKMDGFVGASCGSLQHHYDIIIKLNAHSKSRANLEQIGRTHMGYSIKQKSALLFKLNSKALLKFLLHKVLRE
jgi:hypothetical protein